MHVILVGPDIEENLSIRYLAAALEQAGHRCRIADFRSERDIPEVIQTIGMKQTDLIGLSLVFQTRCNEYFKLVERLRAGGFQGHITAGGHFASLRSNEIMRDVPGIDTILHHEGEERIVELAALLAGSAEIPGSLDGITWRTGKDLIEHRPARRVAPLDGLSDPVRRQPDRTMGIPSAPLVSSRGCAGNCSFCSIQAWHGQVSSARYRMRAPDLVAAEMAELYRRNGVRIFIFHDDNFIHPDPARARERCRRIVTAAEKRIGKRFGFVIKCRPNDVQEDLFAWLKSKGLIRVYIGIETHAASGLRTLNRANTREDNERALAILDSLGIYACFNLLIFDPDTTVDALHENLDFLARYEHRPFDITRTELYACTPLEQRMIREGRVRGDYRGWDYSISDPAAEAVFRLFADILRDRHYGARSILQTAQDLGYRLSVMHRFHPGAVSADLERRIATLIRQVNRDTIGYLEDFQRFVTDRGIMPDPALRREYVESMREQVERRIDEQFRYVATLLFELKISRYLAGIGLSGNRAFSAWPRVLRRLAAALPYAALALGTVTCTDQCVMDPPPPPFTWESQIGSELELNCATSGCHDTETASAGLLLDYEDGYSNLVNAASTQVPRLNRVQPARPDSSYLMNKLEGTHAEVGGTGERMPPGITLREDFSNEVWTWISDGAVNRHQWEDPPESQPPD